ncbi:MAG: glycosyltransferase family 1 protein [Helicobacter sp.]|nr:glycosyltransferase family 1 protein [Helicobacter sp.]
MRSDYYYFANSKYTKSDFLKIFPNLHDDNIEIAYLGADAELFHPDFDISKNAKIKEKYNIPADKSYIFTLHSIDPRKNLEFTTSVFIKYLTSHSISDLVFVMGGGLNVDLANKIKENCIKVAKDQGIKDPEDFVKNHIIFAGYIYDFDIANLFSHCFCSIYLSTYEGFGMPALEALACAAPVIASSTTSLPEVVGDGGLLVDPTNEAELLDALYKIYFDADLRNSLCKRALIQASKFSWEESAKKMHSKMQLAFVESHKNKGAKS